MTVDEVKEYCAGFGGAVAVLHPAPGNVLAYEVGGKQFAYFKTSTPEQWRFSFRTPPERFLELTDMPGVKPARYMGRFHWVTVVKVGAFPADYLEELVAWSYRKAVAGLSRKAQLELAAAQDEPQGPARQAQRQHG